MAKAPAFQFYPRDWLSSPKVQLMTPAEEGAYVRLLCYCWDSGDCSLPDDDDALARLSRLGEGWLKGSSTTIRRCFVLHPHKPGFITNARLLDESTKQAEWSAKCSIGGKKSAEKRYGKAGKRSRNTTAKGSSTKGQLKANRPVELNANSSSSSSSSSSLVKNPLPPALDTERFRTAFAAWVAHRKQKGKPATETAQGMAVKKLAGMGEARAIAAIEHSVANGWDGIFEPKPSDTRGYPSKSERSEAEFVDFIQDAFPELQR